MENKTWNTTLAILLVIVVVMSIWFHMQRVNELTDQISILDNNITQYKQLVNDSYKQIEDLENHITTLEMQKEELRSENEDLKEAYATFKMYYNEKYGQKFDADKGVLGLAFGDFIAVWTKDQSFADMQDTCAHEWMHNNANMIHPEE